MSKKNPFGINILPLKSAPKDRIYFVDAATASRWKEYDRAFRLKWWSPLRLVKHCLFQKRINKTAQAIIKNVPKAKAKP